MGRNLEAAQLFAKRGWKVFPVRSKHKAPLTAHGFHDATLDTRELERWWASNPDANVAVATGADSQLVVLDVDPRNNGEAALDFLTSEYGDLPPTITVETGGGGTHYYFKHPGGVLPSAKPWDGIDLKSDGGYVVAPFSLHPSGAYYRFKPGKDPDSVELAPLPQWLYTELKRQQRNVVERTLESRGTREGDSEAIVEGQRNDALASLAGTMRRRGMSFEAILRALLAENEVRCRPPLADDEVAAVARSIFRYEPDAKASSLPPAARALTFEPSDLKGVLDPDAGKVDYLVDGLIPRGDVVLLAAAWKSGKTLLMYRLVLDAVRGALVLGRFDSASNLRIGVFQEEMPLPEDHRRYRQLAIGAGMDPTQVVDFAASQRLVHLNRTGLNLGHPDHIRRFHELVRTKGLDLVVIDSVLAAFAGQDLDDNSGVRFLFSQAFHPLTSEGRSVILLHHRRKRSQNGPPTDEKSEVLGAQAWGAACGRIFGLERKDQEHEDPGAFRVTLKLLGAWTPSPFRDLDFFIEDRDGGTAVDCFEQPTVVSQADVASDAIIELIRGAPGVLRADAVARLMAEQNVSERTAIRALALAISRGRVLTTARRGAKNGVVQLYTPDGLQPE